MRRFLPSTVFEWLVIGVVLFIAWTFWNGHRDTKDNNEAAVLKSNLAATNAQLKEQRAQLAAKDSELTLALNRGTQVVDRWHTVKEPVYLPSGSTSHDTIQSIARRLNACYAAGDSLVATILPLKSACQAYRDTAKAVIATQKTAYAELDSLYRIAKRGKRIETYGDLMYEPLKQRPVVALGLTSKVFWKLHGKVEAQYAIPRPVADSSSGFRLTVGAHVRF